MGWYARYLGIESILVKYRNEILQPPLRLSAHIMEGKLKILGTTPKSEEITHFYPIFCVFADFYSDMLSRTAMVWLRHFLTSISLANT